jgi:hypothetical protein
MALRRARLSAAVAYHASILLTGLLLAFTGYLFNLSALFDAGAMIILVHLLTFRLLPFDRLFQQRMVRSYTCSACGLAIDLCNSWSCKGKGCGYTAERHLFSPCPQCGKGFAWVNCPRCETSHLI